MHLLSSMQPEVFEKVIDIIQNPPPSNKYENLKAKLLERLSASEEQRISKLLFHAEMGDSSPSDFYRKMKQLAGTSTDVSESFIKRLWIGRLPKPIEVAIISVGEKEISQLLIIADKIWEASRKNSVNEIVQDNYIASMTKAVSTRAIGNNSSEASLIEEIRHLSRRIQALEATVTPRRGRTPYKRFARSTSRKRYTDRDGLCWYHKKYGKDARACTKPCSWNSEEKNELTPRH